MKRYSIASFGADYPGEYAGKTVKIELDERGEWTGRVEDVTGKGHICIVEEKVGTE